jgi:hypothetical protein
MEFVSSEALIIVCAVPLALAVIYFVKERARKRKLAFEQFCLRNGFSVVDNASHPLLTIAEKNLESDVQFELFSKGRDRRFTMLAESHAVDSLTYLGEYLYNSGSGKNRTTYRHSIVAFVNQRKSLPYFSIRPESFIHRILESFGYQDIDLPYAPDFSKNFLLRGNDESAIRSVFTPGLVQAFERSKGICAEGNGQVFLVYSESKRIPIEKLDQFLIEARQLAGCL